MVFASLPSSLHLSHFIRMTSLMGVIQEEIDKKMNIFIERIISKYGEPVNKDKLIEMWKGKETPERSEKMQKIKTCKAILVSGKYKGKECGNKVTEGEGVCGRHTFKDLVQSCIRSSLLPLCFLHSLLLLSYAEGTRLLLPLFSCYTHLQTP